MEELKVKTSIIFIFCLASLILLGNLWTGSLASWDESLYAQVAREISSNGNWIDLTWAGQRWSDKPPLYMWVTALIYKVLGVNEFSARLFSALCGIGTVLATYGLAHSLYSRSIAWCASLILLSTWHFIWSAKVAMLDVTLTFFTSLSLLFWVWGEKNKPCLMLAALAFTLAFLTKGFAAGIIPVILALYLYFAKKYSLLKEPLLWWGIGLSLFILGWWHWLVFSHYGKGFISDYFVKHLLTRTSTSVEGHAGSIFTYLKVVPNKGKPWGALGFIGIAFAGWEMFKRREKSHLLMLVWPLTVLALYSFFKTKLHWYIMPVYPALSILSAVCISRLFRRYAFWAALFLCVVSITYLSVAKSIFYLDYSPEAKKMAAHVKSLMPAAAKIFLYRVGDPAVRFYFGDRFVFVTQKDEIERLMQEAGNYIVFDTSEVHALPAQKFSILYQNPQFTAARTVILQ